MSLVFFVFYFPVEETLCGLSLSALSIELSTLSPVALSKAKRYLSVFFGTPYPLGFLS